MPADLSQIESVSDRDVQAHSQGVPGLLREGSAFTSWAPWYDDSVLQSLLFEPTHSSVLQQLQLHAPCAGRMLDIGCGTGRLLWAAAQRYSFLIGVDPCTQMLDVARAWDPGVGSWHRPRFVCALAEGLPFEAGTFDVVTSTLSLRHWGDPVRGLCELARVLSAAGTLVIADAEADSGVASKSRWRMRRPVGQLRRLLVRCGLEVVDDQEPPVRGPVPRVRVLTARHPR